MRRRDFLTASLATGLAAAGGLSLPRPARAAAGSIHQSATRPLEILFLGGTRFVGPAIVDLAIERGHEVTLFNRGETNPWLYSHVERLVGNRYPDRDAGLSALERAVESGRTWDVVFDTWQDSPLAVRHTAELLLGHAERYVYVSSIAVYQNQYRKESFDESAVLPEREMPESWDAEIGYPARKQLGEEAVAAAFPEAHALLRAYGIFGPDATGRLAEPNHAFWATHVDREGEVLAPGDGDDFLQWTDVRDLAEFAILTAERGLAGGFNISRGATFRTFLEELVALTPRRPELIWAPEDFLKGHDVQPFSQVPLWVPRQEAEGGFFHASTERSRAAGLACRSIRQTFGPILDAFHRNHAAHDFRSGDTAIEFARREEELLAAWKGR